jgi:hypothetical protein
MQAAAIRRARRLAVPVSLVIALAAAPAFALRPPTGTPSPAAPPAALQPQAPAPAAAQSPAPAATRAPGRAEQPATPAPAGSYTPSERIKADSVVSFPVDI